MSKFLILRPTPTVWTAEFVNDPDAVAFFGSATITTAFFASAPSGTVQHFFSLLYPAHTVILCEERRAA